MRNSILLPVFVLLLHYESRSQSVAINTDGSQPNNSALLDLKSDSKGLLLPRMTMQQRTSIPSPATGLLVYQTEAPEGFYYNKGTPAAPDWVLLNTTAPTSGIFNSGFKAGAAPYPSPTLAFISDPVIITITAGQKVFVTSSRAMGGYAAANELNIFPAYQSVEPGSAIQNLSLGIDGMQVAANTRITFSISGIFKDLPAGTYRFGMSGYSTSPNWVNCEWSYTSVLVF
ncbi:MAG TPA: hypothetical protein VHM26_13960 [Chitinophagaceae bacterium]|jgi:hypothetical protein|nr:hypothetical protein [Chitinophagaceae bacterium]